MKIFLAFLGIILSYLISSFIEMNINLLNWSNKTLIFSIFLTIFVVSVFFIINYALKKQCKKIEKLYSN